MKKLAALWSGDLPLSEAFWTWAIFIGLPLNLTTSLASLVLISADRPWEALVAGYLLSVPYNVVVLVGVWRAATHYPGEPRHADFARVTVAIMMVLLTVT